MPSIAREKWDNVFGEIFGRSIRESMSVIKNRKDLTPLQKIDMMMDYLNTIPAKHKKLFNELKDDKSSSYVQLYIDMKKELIDYILSYLDIDKIMIEEL